MGTRGMNRPLTVLTASTIGAALGLYLAAATQPDPAQPSTIVCQRVHIDDLAVEAIEAVDRLRWRYPEERIVIDEADGSVRALPVALVPSPCDPAIEEDEILIITE